MKVLLGLDVNETSVVVRVGTTPVRIDLYGVVAPSNCQLQFEEVVMTGGGVTLDSVDCGCGVTMVEPLTPTYSKPYSAQCCERVFLDFTRTYLYLSRPGLVRMTLVGDCTEATVIATEAQEGYTPTPAEQGCCAGVDGGGGAICEQLNALPPISFGPSDPFPTFSFPARNTSNQCFRFDSSLFQKLNNLCSNIAATPAAPTTFPGIPALSFVGYDSNSTQCYRFTLEQIRGTTTDACSQLAALPVLDLSDTETARSFRFLGRDADGECHRTALPPIEVTGSPGPFFSIASDEDRRYRLDVTYNAANFAGAVSTAIGAVATESPTVAAPMTLRLDAGGSVRKAPFHEFGRAIPTYTNPPTRLVGQTASGDLVSVALNTIELEDYSGTLIARFLAVSA